jgi:hypothetical protein
MTNKSSKGGKSPEQRQAEREALLEQLRERVAALG